MKTYAPSTLNYEYPTYYFFVYYYYYYFVYFPLTTKLLLLQLQLQLQLHRQFPSNHLAAATARLIIKPTSSTLPT